MKNILLLFSICLYSQCIAQTSNLVVFTEQGEAFYLILNGIRQNGTAETNVKVTGLNQPGYALKIIFEDNTLGEVDKNVMLEAGMEVVANVKRNKEGKFVVRYQSSTAIQMNIPAQQNQQVVAYSTSSVPITTSTTSTTTSTSSGNNANVNMNVGGLNMNVQINDGTGATQNTTSTTTTTTTQSYSNSAATGNSNNNGTYQMPGYGGAVGCPWPMSNADFANAKNSIASKNFEDSKLQIARQVITSNCIVAAQVREIMLLFSFEDSRLDFAKYAYGYTYDLGNYFKVNDAFQFESSVDDLNRYISSVKR